MDPINRFLISAILNAGWQAFLFTAAATLGSWICRRHPARQFAIWLAAFLLLILAPALSLRSYPGSIAGSVTGNNAWASVPMHPATPISSGYALGNGVLTLWALSALIAIVRTLSGMRRTRQIVRSASPLEIPEPEIPGLTAQHPARQILSTPHPIAPFVLGIRRPRIVVPENILSDDADVLRSVLAHELVHIRRRDFLWNLILQVLFPLVAFHPCAHWIRAKLRNARELACDEAVASLFPDRTRYAASLLEVALKSAPELSATRLGTIGEGGLEERVRRLMTTRPGRERWRAARMPASLALLLIVFSLSTLCSFEPANPLDFTGVWRQNWAAAAFRPNLQLNPADCCFMTLEIRYRNGRFEGSTTSDSAGVEGNRVIRGPRTVLPLVDPVLDSGVLTFHQPRGKGAGAETYEVTLAPKGAVLVRSQFVPPAARGWTAFAPVH
jgi:beta-lactamase regulating signal transducer with metallopeptidase domain